LQASCYFVLFCHNIMTVKIINKSKNALPNYETEGSAGMDLRADITEPVTLKPLERAMIPTGIFIELPIGYEAQVRPRSGLAAKRGLTCLNSPGTIDADYRGELKVILVNLSNDTQIIEPAERIAQMVVAKHERVVWSQVTQLSDTVRGAGGFGSTGTK
jgi:dUTP pyrophosphatase